jgi:hypothetical protein
VAIATDNLRRCKKCQVLYDNSSSNKGFCPADGHQHERGGFNYQLSFRFAKPNTQSDWRRCKKCQAIFFNGMGQGRCAADVDARDPHTADMARDFGVPYGDSETEHVQTGWEFCTKCNGLFYSRSKTPNANHWTAGGEHASSPEARRYNLVHGRPLPVLFDEGTELHPVNE